MLIGTTRCDFVHRPQGELPAIRLRLPARDAAACCGPRCAAHGPRVTARCYAGVTPAVKSRQPVNYNVLAEATTRLSSVTSVATPRRRVVLARCVGRAALSPSQRAGWHAASVNRCGPRPGPPRSPGPPGPPSRQSQAAIATAIAAAPPRPGLSPPPARADRGVAHTRHRGPPMLGEPRTCGSVRPPTPRPPLGPLRTGAGWPPTFGATPRKGEQAAARAPGRSRPAARSPPLARPRPDLTPATSVPDPCPPRPPPPPQAEESRQQRTRRPSMTRQQLEPSRADPSHRSPPLPHAATRAAATPPTRAALAAPRQRGDRHWHLTVPVAV